ncbi:HNH endonuclease [Corynebacterium glutamicum]|uniref:HNH endonuclease n=1 Tax=Corynebacterium glutamicum TaxID=1718 RepID=UPI001B8CA6B9|nr:HNH endonuclease signature motif containing protein [Corynebacterium glutamicum]
MNKLPLPESNASKAFKDSIDSIKDKEMKKRFQSVSPMVKQKCDTFEVDAMSLSFSSMTTRFFTVPGISSDEMVSLYDRQFRNNKEPKKIHDAIKGASGTCPYCGQGKVKELDHYLPKSEFMALVVHPFNLVPSCRDCNHDKRAYRPSLKKPAVLHPYFDKAFDTPWLSAEIKRDQESPEVAIVEFTVELNNPNADLEARLNAHLDVFDLRSRFSQWGSQILNEFENFLQNGASLTLEKARIQFGFQMEISSSITQNSWRSATYNAILRSDWYLPSLFPSNKTTAKEEN